MNATTDPSIDSTPESRRPETIEPTNANAASDKLSDAETPGYQAEFDPAEADAAGAFLEDALSEADATTSSHDLQFAIHSSSREQSR
jgi:hypothetical protein